MKTALKKTHIGASDSVVAYMVKIDWTSAPVVRITTNRDFKMTMYQVAHVRENYTVLSSVQVSVQASEVMYFVASGLDGYYYRLMYTGTTFGCTCKAGRFHKACHHQIAVNEWLYRKEMRRQVAAEAPELIVMEEQLAYAFEMAGCRIPAGTAYRVSGLTESQFVYRDWDVFLPSWKCTCGSEDCEHLQAVYRYQDCAEAA